eukprot:388895-Pleurochrysis_carterae.AAC.2
MSMTMLNLAKGWLPPPDRVCQTDHHREQARCLHLIGSRMISRISLDGSIGIYCICHFEPAPHAYLRSASRFPHMLLITARAHTLLCLLALPTGATAQARLNPRARASSHTRFHCITRMVHISPGVRDCNGMVLATVSFRALPLSGCIVNQTIR